MRAAAQRCPGPAGKTAQVEHATGDEHLRLPWSPCRFFLGSSSTARGKDPERVPCLGVAPRSQPPMPLTSLLPQCRLLLLHSCCDTLQEGLFSPPSASSSTPFSPRVLGFMTRGPAVVWGAVVWGGREGLTSSNGCRLVGPPRGSRARGGGGGGLPKERGRGAVFDWPIRCVCTGGKGVGVRRAREGGSGVGERRPRVRLGRGRRWRWDTAPTWWVTKALFGPGVRDHNRPHFRHRRVAPTGQVPSWVSTLTHKRWHRGTQLPSWIVLLRDAPFTTTPTDAKCLCASHQPPTRAGSPSLPESSSHCPLRLQTSNVIACSRWWPQGPPPPRALP